MDGKQNPFNLRKWFSIVSFVVTTAVATVFGAALSSFFVSETLERDAALTAQFIQSIAETEVRHGRFGGERLTLGQFLDPRVAAATLGMDEAVLSRVRGEYFDHLRALPDILLVTVFAADRSVVWSTNPELEGRVIRGNDDLDEVFASRRMVAGTHLKGSVGDRPERQFVRFARDFYIENYIPLLDPAGNVASVVEIYKEPQDLIAAIERGYLLIWAAALASGVVVFVALRSIVDRAVRQLDAQQRLLVDNETLVSLGEMASAVAHGLRNPLASIRSSAELALEAGGEPVAKNLNDIITQVDRLSKWVRELLQFSRPLSDEREAVALTAAVDDALASFDVQIRRAGIELDWAPAAQPPLRVLANGALLAQALNSVLSNAIEAMPQGGRLRIAIGEPARGRIELCVSDTGCGMSAAQLALAFRPFHTTKRGGLGIGLSLVRRVMERFGGEVRLESSEGVGTTLCLVFKRDPSG